jgi:hypothetical protein
MKIERKRNKNIEVIWFNLALAQMAVPSPIEGTFLKFKIYTFLFECLA